MKFQWSIICIFYYWGRQAPWKRLVYSAHFCRGTCILSERPGQQSCSRSVSGASFKRTYTHCFPSPGIVLCSLRRSYSYKNQMRARILQRIGFHFFPPHVCKYWVYTEIFDLRDIRHFISHLFEVSFVIWSVWLYFCGSMPIK